MTKRGTIALLIIAGGLGLLMVWIVGELIEFSAIYHPDVYQEER